MSKRLVHISRVSTVMLCLACSCKYLLNALSDIVVEGWFTVIWRPSESCNRMKQERAVCLFGCRERFLWNLNKALLERCWAGFIMVVDAAGALNSFVLMKVLQFDRVWIHFPLLINPLIIIYFFGLFHFDLLSTISSFTSSTCIVVQEPLSLATTASSSLSGTWIKPIYFCCMWQCNIQHPDSFWMLLWEHVFQAESDSRSSVFTPCHTKDALEVLGRNNVLLGA